MHGRKQALANLVDGTLRDCNAVKIRYSDLAPTDQIYRSMVSVGNQDYYGSSVYCYVDAQTNAAYTAHEALKELSGEDELRDLLGLPVRKHIREVDDVRDCLRRLKRRYRARFGHPYKEASLNIIGKIYSPLDKMEKDLIECTGMFD